MFSWLFFDVFYCYVLLVSVNVRVVNRVVSECVVSIIGCWLEFGVGLVGVGDVWWICNGCI